MYAALSPPYDCRTHLKPMQPADRTRTRVRPAVCASVCEYVCGVSVCVHLRVCACLCYLGGLGLVRVLRRMGCTLGYSRGTPRKCVGAGVLTSVKRAVHLLALKGTRRVLKGTRRVLTWGTLGTLMGYSGYSHRPIVRSLSERVSAQ